VPTDHLIFRSILCRSHPRVPGKPCKVAVLVPNQQPTFRSVFSGWSVPTDHLNFTIFLPPFAAGTIPESLGNLMKLVKLDLSCNKLTGQFFFYFSGWSVPTDHLCFTIFLPPFAAGTIPESLGNLMKLVKLDLSRNKLPGQFFFIFWDGRCPLTI
jgi:hypothetical protein